MKLKQGRTVSEEAFKIANTLQNLFSEIEERFGIRSNYGICLVPQKRGTLLKVEISNSFAFSSALPPQVTGSPQKIRKIVIGPLVSILDL